MGGWGGGETERDASSSGVSDKTMGKFYCTAAFVKALFDKRASSRHYGLNAGAKS